MAVARAKGVQFAPNTLSDMLRHIGAMPAHAKSSMLEDLEHGRRLELPWLNGKLVRVGEDVGTPTPIHRFIATVLKPFVDGRPAPKPREPLRMNPSKSH